MAIKTLNGIEAIIADKSADELIEMWNHTEFRKLNLIDSVGLKNRDQEFDAVIRVRQWIMKAMQEKMTDAEFCKVVGQ